MNWNSYSYLKVCAIMETLVISPNFTIEDIHKVRENNYNITKGYDTTGKTRLL